MHKSGHAYIYELISMHNENIPNTTQIWYSALGSQRENINVIATTNIMEYY